MHATWVNGENSLQRSNDSKELSGLHPQLGCNEVIRKTKPLPRFPLATKPALAIFKIRTPSHTQEISRTAGVCTLATVRVHVRGAVHASDSGYSALYIGHRHYGIFLPKWNLNARQGYCRSGMNCNRPGRKERSGLFFSLQYPIAPRKEVKGDVACAGL